MKMVIYFCLLSIVVTMVQATECPSDIGKDCKDKIYCRDLSRFDAIDPNAEIGSCSRFLKQCAKDDCQEIEKYDFI